MIKRTSTKAAGPKVTFILPQNDPQGRVSVVGDFNNWTPGLHELRKRSNGTRSVSVAVAAGSTITFRYLGEDGQWFDDPQAELSEAGGVFTV